MRIGVEARTLFCTPLTGLGNYTWNILRALQRTQKDTELYLYLPSTFKDCDLLDLARAKIRHYAPVLGLKGYFWTKFISPFLIQRDSLDCYIAPRVLFPYFVGSAVPTVAIVADLNIYLCPEKMPRGTRISYSLWYRSDVLKADRIVTVSKGTSDRLMQRLGRSADAIVPPAVSQIYQPVHADLVLAVKQKYGIQGPYIVFVGTLEPRKNLATLIAAHRAFNASRPDAIKLVLVGKRGWKNESLVTMLDRGVPNVMETGYAPEADLPALYTGSEAFVIPSFYEGYGMPAAEARACGTRVIATDIPELREAAGPDGTFVPPTVEGLLQGLRGSLERPRPTGDRRHSWDDSARLLADVLRDAAHHRAGRRL